MKAKSKRNRNTSRPSPLPRVVSVFDGSSDRRLTRRGSTVLADDRPQRRGSSDSSQS
jgi:hypothetical protein